MDSPFLFIYAGRPWLSQNRTRQLIDCVYSGISPQKGYSGNEDEGLMGSHAVLLKMGLFLTNGVNSEKFFYEITSLIINKFIIHLNPNYYRSTQFVIGAKNNDAKNMHTQFASFIAKPLNQPKRVGFIISPNQQ